MDVPIPESMRDKTLSLLKCPMAYGVYSLVFEGVAVDGAWGCVAVNGEQWFLPKGVGVSP